MLLPPSAIYQALSSVGTSISPEMEVHIKMSSNDSLKSINIEAHKPRGNRKPEVSIFNKRDMEIRWGATQASMKSKTD
jgi:hypothetical protein